MTTFLTIVGIIALFIIGKFIFDTNLTSKTEKNLDENKRNNPTDADRNERDKGLDFNSSPKTMDQEKAESLLRLATNMDCLPSQAKDKYFSTLKAKGFGTKDYENLINMIKEENYKESQTLGIDPDNTTSAFIEEWTNEYMKYKVYADRKRTINDVTDDLLYENPFLKKIADTGNKSMVEDYLSENEDLSISFLKDMAYAKEPAEGYRQKAIVKKYDDKDIIGAIQLINKGLMLNELKTEPYLYSFRSECHEDLNNLKEALIDMNKAIISFEKNISDKEGLIHFHYVRARIKNSLGDIIGADQDRKIAEEYNRIYRDGKQN